MSAMTVVCPFCPLHCDDVNPAALRAGETGCRVADSRANWVRRESSSLATSADLETCRRWVEEASQIVISGYVIDLETARAISEFAATTGAVVKVNGTNPTASKLFAREGGFYTTLGELSSRAVSVLVIGDPATHWPRLEERLRHVKAIVRWPDSSALPQRIAALRLHTAKRFSDQSTVDDELAAAIQLVIDSTYLVVLIAPLHETIARSPVVWSSIFGLVRERNKVSRAAILSFDPSVTVRSVLASRNDPLPFAFPCNESSLCIEFSPFGERSSESTGRKIIIGLAKPSLGSNQRLLPAGVPGMHHAGIVIRGDGSVTLPLQSWQVGSHVDNLPATPAEYLRLLQGNCAT